MKFYVRVYENYMTNVCNSNKVKWLGVSSKSFISDFVSSSSGSVQWSPQLLILREVQHQP